MIDNIDKENNKTSITNLSQLPVFPPSNLYKATPVTSERSFTSVVLAKADSGASQHYLCPKDAKVLTNLHSTFPGPIVHLPDNSTIQATHKGGLPLKHGTALPPAATKTHVFPQLQSSSLVSIGQLCDDNCIAILDKQEINVYKNKQLIFKGHRNPSDGLWDIPLHPSRPIAACLPASSPAPFQPVANAISCRNKTCTELAQYHHATAGSPPIETFFAAITKGNFLTWPGIELL